MASLKLNNPTLIQKHSLWMFSLEFYADNTNKEALLFLQDQYHFNVNVLLALLWHAASGRGSCSTATIETLLSVIDPWQTLITEHLRTLRQSLKDKHAEVYKAVLETEIHSEQLQQCVIYDFFINSYKTSVSNKRKAQDGISNLQTYLKLSKAHLSDQGHQYIRHLLAQAFPAFEEFDYPQMSLGF